MQRKQENFNKFWHNDEWINDNIQKASEFNYNKAVSELKKFTGEHPKIMKKRINEKNWKFDYDIAYDKRSLKDKIKQFLKKYFGIDIGYKNYRITIKKHT
jgi:ribosomal protein S18